MRILLQLQPKLQNPAALLQDLLTLCLSTTMCADVPLRKSCKDLKQFLVIKVLQHTIN